LALTLLKLMNKEKLIIKMKKFAVLAANFYRPQN